MRFNDNNIKIYLHCKLCVEELPKDESPSTYADYAVGWTKKGIQVWCERHNANIIHIDFEGEQHKADLTRNDKKITKKRRKSMRVSK